MAKFPSILGTNTASSMKTSSTNEENQQIPSQVEYDLHSTPSTASNASNESPTTSSPDQKGNVIAPLFQDDLQAPPGIVVGSFDNIKTKFEFHLKKNIKKNNLEGLISLIDVSNNEFLIIKRFTNLFFCVCRRNIVNMIPHSSRT